MNNNEKIFGNFILAWKFHNNSIEWNIERNSKIDHYSTFIFGLLNNSSNIELFIEGADLYRNAFTFNVDEWNSIKEALDFVFLTLKSKI